MRGEIGLSCTYWPMNFDLYNKGTIAFMSTIFSAFYQEIGVLLYFFLVKSTICMLLLETLVPGDIVLYTSFLMSMGDYFGLIVLEQLTFYFKGFKIFVVLVGSRTLYLS